MAGTPATITMASRKAKVFYRYQMDLSLWDTSKMIFQTGQGPYSIITMKNTKGKLETDSDMEVESITIVMHQSIKVNLGIT